MNPIIVKSFILQFRIVAQATTTCINFFGKFCKQFNQNFFHQMLMNALPVTMVATMTQPA